MCFLTAAEDRQLLMSHQVRDVARSYGNAFTAKHLSYYSQNNFKTQAICSTAG